VRRISHTPCYGISIIEISLLQSAMIFIQVLEPARFKIQQFEWAGLLQNLIEYFLLSVEPSPESKAQHIDAGHQEQHRTQNRSSLVHEKQAHVE